FETLASHANVALENGRLVAHLQHEAREQAYLALHDPVTGLPNRSSLTDRLGSAVERAAAADSGCALIFVDLDTFKEVNDTLGIATGDRLLVEVRQRVEALLPSTALLARFTGDQFAVLVPGVKEADSVAALAETIHRAFDTPFTSDAVSLALGASLGIALYPEHASSAELLLQRADAATYRARLEGSGIEVYSPESDPYAPRRLALAADLREALEHNEVDVYVQPKASLADGCVVGAEALVRWTHPRLGPLSPDQFIPAAEHTGVIRALTLYVVRDALRQCRAWRDDGLDLTISVNLSARNLFDSHLVEDIGAAITEAGVPASALTLELTESTVMSGSRRSLAVLEGLQRIGVRLSVDDFGTGYSSLTHLRHLPVSELKVDKSFVSTMTTNEHDRVIVRTLVDLGRSLGLCTVAEGVETQEAWDMLRDFGCEEAQGYLLSRPLPDTQLTTWLARQHVRRIDRGHEVVPFPQGRRAVGDALDLP
ncbi:MAG: putative bifunctional diguanylate cyclase/phosphodiesterase, partial [Acidimicrobiales bacterium]